MIWLLLLATATLGLVGGALVLWEALHPPRRTSGWAVAQRLPIDPEEAGLPYHEWTLDRPDGAHLPVWDIDGTPEPAGDSSGDPSAELNAPREIFTVVLIHGWGRSRIDSLDRLRALHRAVEGRIGRAILPDLRGHGEATGPGCRLGAKEIDDILELLRRITDDRIVLVGHSMGAVLAIAAAARLDVDVRTRVRGVIAYAPYRRLAIPIANRLLFRNSPGRPLAAIALLLGAACVPRRMDTVEFARALAAARIPLLVVAGARDAVAPPLDAETIAAAGNGEFITIPAAAHADVHSADPETHDVALRDWLARRLLRRTSMAAASTSESEASSVDLRRSKDH